MKILYVTLGLGEGGGIRIILEHANRLTERGHEVYVIPLARTKEEQAKAAQSKTPPAPEVKWMPTKCKFAPVEDFQKVAENMDVVLATEANTARPVAEIRTNAKKFYFVQMRESLFFMHGNPLWAGGVELDYQNMKGVLSPIVISWWLKDFLEEEFGYEDVPIVPNGVNTDMFYPDPKWPRTGYRRILIEGHTHGEAKDVEFMSLNIVKWYRSTVEPVELWGFSQLPPPKDYKGFNKFFVLPSQDTIRQIYSSCTVLLKASRYEGRSCLGPEAMSCGLPVVRAIIEGDDDLIHGYNCLLSRYGDMNAFASNLNTVLAQDIVRKSLITNGLQYAKHSLNWDNFIPRLEIIFDGGTPERIPRKEEMWEFVES